MKEYTRKPLYDELWKRLITKPNLIQVIIGPRQVGKTTLVLQVYNRWKGPKLYKTADLPNIPTVDWIMQNWEEGIGLYKKKKRKTLLIFDEIQKIPRWSEVVKKMFDEDKRLKRNICIALLGSSSLLMQKGLTESLAGRFEIHRHSHWTFAECREYFNLKLEEYIYFGGYPGAMPLRKDEQRWTKYVRDSLIETVLSKDIILMTPITKPALLRQTFGLGITHPAEIISYQKMLGQLQDAGNATTIASYLRLLSNAFILAPLERYSGSRIKQRGSIPKILVLDNALISATAGLGFKSALKDKKYWGRMVENAVGARIYTILQDIGGELFYWRDRNNEVDYIVKVGQKLIAVEVKSGTVNEYIPSLNLFARRYRKANKIYILQTKHDKIKENNDNIKYIYLSDFFNNPAESIGI